jgi:hypothetical protein
VENPCRIVSQVGLGLSELLGGGGFLALSSARSLSKWNELLGGEGGFIST